MRPALHAPEPTPSALHATEPTRPALDATESTTSATEATDATESTRRVLAANEPTPHALAATEPPRTVSELNAPASPAADASPRARPRDVRQSAPQLSEPVVPTRTGPGSSDSTAPHLTVDAPALPIVHSAELSRREPGISQSTVQQPSRRFGPGAFSHPIDAPLHQPGPTQSADTGEDELSARAPHVIGHAAPPLEEAMLRPWEATDDELARVIASLPPAMAAAAVAAGVLEPHAAAAFRTSTPTDPLSTTSYATPLEMHAPRSSVVLPPRRESARSDWQSPLTPFHAPPAANSVVPHGLTATPAVSASTSVSAPGIARAPLDREPDDNAPATTVAASPGLPTTGGAATAPNGGQQQQPQDLDRLADDVYARLRWRLIGESERHMGHF
jgi:hypothetical protein